MTSGLPTHQDEHAEREEGKPGLEAVDQGAQVSLRRGGGEVVQVVKGHAP